MKIEQQIFAYKELRNNGQAFFIDTYEDADRIIESLEKQIPIVPSEINDEALKLDGIFDWCCGKCGTHHRNDFLLNYCSECGQAIKWE